MKKSDIVALVLKDKLHLSPAVGTTASAFAPVNIALSKYWGKRDVTLNLPMTSSISLSLGNKGATTELMLTDSEEDLIVLNGQVMAPTSNFGKRLIDFLNLFRPAGRHFAVKSVANVPIAAGLASSASGFASLVRALDQLFAWQLTPIELSILARLGSGSACRSLWPGFVEWQVGAREDGMDSHGLPLSPIWPELCLGWLIFDAKEKLISSREAMQHTVVTSPFYTRWTDIAETDCATIKSAINAHDFEQLGKTAEVNAMAMHATILAARPAMSYCVPETIAAMHTIWDLRKQGLSIYFTQDAGPNLKLLFLANDLNSIALCFPHAEMISLHD